MAVRIRLTRVGATKRPAYRVIAIDRRRSRDGRALEILGYYDPLTEPATVQLETEKISAWIGKGAQPSDMVVRLMRQVEKAAAEPSPAEKPKRATRPRAATKPKATTGRAAAKASTDGDTTAPEAARAEDAAAETAPSEETDTTPVVAIGADASESAATEPAPAEAADETAADAKGEDRGA